MHFLRQMTRSIDSFQEVPIKKGQFQSLAHPKENVELVKDYLRNSIVTPEATKELLQYIEDAFFRLLMTLEIIPDGVAGDSLLELGSNPYFMTLLVKRFRDYNLSLANYFETDEKQITQVIENATYGEHHIFESKLFNIEKDRFPYTTRTFSVVLFCEIIEHLREDPLRPLGEIHRVLKPSGPLIMTTPNVCRASNLEKLARGMNIYDPYSRHGIYGRHNREYTIQEIRELLAGTGFVVEKLFTKYVHFQEPDENWWDINSKDDGRGDYIFVQARRASEFRPYRPSWLFR